MMDALLHDLRYALRSFLRSPGFAAVAIASLALGIGANTAIFATIEAAILRPLPVAAPERLALVSLERGEDGSTPNFSYEVYRHIAADPAFAGALTFSPQPLDLAGESGTERLSGELVSENYFGVLGVAPVRGRAFSRAGGAPALEAIISHDLWRTRFAADPEIVGKTVRLNGQPFTVAGVAPEGFRGVTRGADPAVWVPVTTQPLLTPGSDYVNDPQTTWLFVVGRLAPGVTHAQAGERLTALMRARDTAGEIPATWRTQAEPGSHGFGPLLWGTQRPLWLLLGAVGIVLLIACANVANLLLARAASRRRELAIRASLGAGRGRLARQLITETVLLALIGGAFGVLVALWTTNVLAGFRPPAGQPVRLDAGPSLPVLAFCLGLSLLTGGGLGLVAAARAAQRDLVPALKAQPGADGGRGRIGARGVLVAVQVALAVVLLVGAGLFLRSLRNLQAIDPGFGARNVLLASVDLEAAGYEPERGRAFYARLLESVRALPGVEAASLAARVTPQPAGSNMSGVVVEGYTPAEGEEVGFDFNVVDAGYFEALRVPLVGGRGFGEADHADAPPVMVVNETMARRYWPGADPVGRYVRLGPEPDAPRLQVVGVARDGKYRELREEPRPNAYMPLSQRFRPAMTLVVRTRGEPSALAGAVRAQVRELDPALPVFDVRTLRQHLGLAVSQDRMAATLITAFGALALLLAAVGVFGVLAYWVAQRTKEIGIRMALGASRASVLRLVLGRGMAFVAAGLAVGMLASLGLTRVAASLLYGVSPTDPLAFAVGAAVLGGVALLAGWLPAARAARVDPMVALRQE